MEKISQINSLRIGDYVTFKDAKAGGSLCAEGILLHDLGLVDNPKVFDDSLFCIHLQRQYSAAKELEEFVKKDKVDVRNIADANTAKYYQALKRGSENESRLNDTYLSKSIGRGVQFGDVIQLFHVKSGKYLKILPDQLAKDERENIRIVLDAAGGSYSWLQVCPRYKIDREGDRVLHGAEILLKVAERSNEFIHRSDRPPLPGQDIEVNCSLEATSWRLSIFRSAVDAIDSRLLLSSELVYISDPETRCNLRLAPTLLESLDGDTLSIHRGAGLPSEEVRAFTADDDTADQTQHFHDFGDLILQSYDTHINSDFLWFVEAFPATSVASKETAGVSLTSGGPIKLKTDKVRFKHMNSSRYLKTSYITVVHTSDTAAHDAVEDEEGFDALEMSEHREERSVWSTTFDGSDPATAFTLSEVSSPGNKFLQNSKALQIGHGGLWLERGPLENGNYIVRVTEDKSLGVSLFINRFAETAVESSAGSSLDHHSSSSHRSIEPLDAYVGMSVRDYLQKYLVMTVLPGCGVQASNTLWPRANRSDLPFFFRMIKQVVLFSQGFPISAENVLLGIDKGNLKLKLHRQSMLREQGTIEVLLRLIHKLVPITERSDAIKNAPPMKKSQQHKSPSKPRQGSGVAAVEFVLPSDEELAALEMGRVILTACFDLLYYVIVDHTENQIYVADFLPDLLAHLSSQPMAGKCVTEMLSKNWELQETKITKREIQIFVDKLRGSKMNAMYLQLLQSCCSCEGDGVDGNQGKVAELLFADTNDIIIHLHADFHRTNNGISWNQPNLYVPHDPVPGSPVLAESLVSRGLPRLSLAWTTNSIDFSPLGLFGKLSVQIEELFGPASDVVQADRQHSEGGATVANAMKNKKTAALDQKRAVAQYFVAELFLGAEMCMDRNYIAMHKWDSLFPYEVLVSLLRMDLAPSVQAAAARLLMCLHIDRDPQATTKIPVLTRCYSDIEKSETPKLPCVEAGRFFTFGLVQQLISEHLRHMRNRRWEEVSRHMLRLLRTLVEFNFYGTIERLRDVIEPLIMALDRRAVVWTPGTSPTAGATTALSSTVAAVDSSGAVAAIEPAATEEPPQHFVQDDNEQQQSWFQRVVSSVSHRWSRSRDYTELDNVSDEGGIESKPQGQSGALVSTMKGRHGLPTRYSKAPTFELETMVEIVDILAFSQRVIEDRNLSLLLRAFYVWTTGLDRRTPSQLFDAVLEEARALTMDVASFDDVMIDTLMFEHNDLVQSALEVLMAHHSSRLTLLHNVYDLQLLASPVRERQFRIVDAMLRQLEQNAETQELWGGLCSDADRQINTQTLDILVELTEICRVKQSAIDIDDEHGEDDFRPDPAMQDLYRNLGAWEICKKVLDLLDSVEEEDADGESTDGRGENSPDEPETTQPRGGLSEANANTKRMCRLCNELLYWFTLDNPKNQSLGYAHLDFFLDTLDEEIGSHLVLKAIFSRNEFLMRQVPHSYLNDMVNLIIDKGKSQHYLTLLTAITHVGDKNIYENQLEICKTLTSPGPLQKVSCYFVPVDHSEYAEKRALMAPYLSSVRDVSIEELPPLLSYHLVFLEVLSGCTVGSKNMTTIEAKVQSVYHYDHILQSILDPGTITLCKIRLSLFFYNSFLEVDLKVPGLEQSPEVWKLLESYRGVLGQAVHAVETVTLRGWDAPGVSKQKLQYLVVCAMIISGFFEFYYQSAAFQGDDREATGAATIASPTVSTSSATVTSPAKSKVQFSLTHVDELILYFFTKLKEIYDIDSPAFADSTKKMLFKCLTVLNRSVSGDTPIVTFIAPPASGDKSKSSVGRAVSRQGVATGPEVDDEENEFEVAEDPEKDLLRQFKLFHQSLKSDAALQFAAENENVAFIRLLESLPYLNDPYATADVRYETLIQKLVLHIRENIKMVNNQKRMDARVTQTSTWIVRAFRTMIENRMGMSIYERDEDGGEEQDLSAAPVVNALNTCGATTLCLDLIADGIDATLQLEAVKLGVGLLFKEGGALEVQGILNNHLRTTDSELFFRQIRLTLQKLQAWHEWNGFERQEELRQEAGNEDDSLEPPPEILVVRFLQLMCEGHYLPNQDILRDQPHNRVSYNVLDDLVNYLNFLSSNTPCRVATQAAIRVSATILEVIQGPCVGNQLHLTLNTELVETLNRIHRGRLENDCESGEQVTLKKTAVDICQGLLEGQGEHSAIYERVLSVLHLDIIQAMSSGEILQNADGEEGLPEEADEESAEERAVLQTECVVLLQMLRNFKPSLAQELGLSDRLEDIVGADTAMIEVIWRGEIHPRFFHVPSICKYLAKTSKDQLVENVDRKNPENKLVDFLFRAHELYLEVKHQEWLTHQKLSHIFSRENQNRATWVTFLLAMVINIVLLFSYDARSGEPKLSAASASAISILNLVQAIVAGFVLLLFLVVRIPVKHQSLCKQGYSEYEAWVYTAMEPMTLYYIWYLTFSILGQVLSYHFLPFLLMDIVVKNSTTRDVLNAVIFPRRQILMGGVVILIIVQIYSFFLFLYFRNETVDQASGFCDSLWGCYLTTLGYGLRNGGGVGDAFQVSIANRWPLDITFYFAITVGMLNLIGGVIITTFGQLRENKARIHADTVGMCFICGIDKQVFDRASDQPEGFKTHVKIDHNMWNYLYFIFLLWEQDKDDDDGLEQYVRRAIAGNDISWFPMNKAIRLRQAATKEESMLSDLTSKLSSVEAHVSQHFDRFSTDISIVLEQLNQMLKQDHAESMPTRTGTESRFARSRQSVSLNPKELQRAVANSGHGVAAAPRAPPADLMFQQQNTVIQRTLFLEVVEVSGVRLPRNAITEAGMPQIHGTLEFEDVVHWLTVDKISRARVTFMSNRNRILDNVQCDDDRVGVFRLWVTDAEENASTEIAMVQVAAEELYLAEGTLLEIYLDADVAVPTQKRRKIVVVPSIEKRVTERVNGGKRPSF